MINPYALVVGQTIVILYPSQTYTVQQDDTLATIADNNGISLMQLMRNNPILYDREYIYTGESLVISYDTVKDVQVIGYTYAYLNRDILIRALPYLTFISIFNYRITENANIINYGDETEIIKMAKEYDTHPLMMISSFSPTGELNIEQVYELLLGNEQQDKFINDTLQILRTKGFMGINLIITYIKGYNLSLYLNFFAKLSSALRNEGYIFFITISPEYSITYENLDYNRISTLVDRIVFLQNVWDMNKQPPSPISNISLIKPFIEQITNTVSPKVISLGLPLIGLDWELPFIPTVTIAKTLSLNSVLALAYEQRAVIQFDEVSQTPYFEYIRSTVGAPENHIVWFIDARSINALDDVIIDYNLDSTGLWHLTTLNQQLFSMINSTFNIIKLPIQ
jgi:spore germination protein